jgi:hypothetical protein
MVLFVVGANKRSGSSRAGNAPIPLRCFRARTQSFFAPEELVVLAISGLTAVFLLAVYTVDKEFAAEAGERYVARLHETTEAASFGRALIKMEVEFVEGEPTSEGGSANNCGEQRKQRKQRKSIRTTTDN